MGTDEQARSPLLISVGPCAVDGAAANVGFRESWPSVGILAFA
jgi:hypothetical protein